MLSICGSIYQNANIVPFVRSVLDNAKNPDLIEFSVVEDEAGSDLMAKCFDEIRAMTPRFSVMGVTKQERIAYFARCIGFYVKEQIFPAKQMIQFRRRLGLYEKGKQKRIWFPPSRNYNKSIEVASGDVILITPLDLLVDFDLSESYQKMKEALTSREYLSLQFGLYQGNEKRQHGIRIFSRNVYEALKQVDPKFHPEPFSFDERWFCLSFYEDDWNEKARLVGGDSRGWEEFFGEKRCFAMPPSPWVPEYLSENMRESWPGFIEAIRNYIARPAAPEPEAKVP